MARFRPDLRVLFVGFAMLVALFAVVVRLYWVQVRLHDEYVKRIRGKSEVTVRIPSIRGDIRDRNEVVLVTNRASYDVDFYLPEMVRGYRERFGAVPLATYRTTVGGFFQDREEPDIVEIVNEAVIPRLEQLDLARGYNSRRLRLQYRTNTEVPFTYLEDLPYDTLARYAENDLGLPGVELSLRPARRYVYGALAAHLLGYTGAPEKIERSEAAKFDYYQADVEGKAQVEQIMDGYLRGSPGIRVMRKNAKGRIEGVSRVEPPKQGANVHLTIDARLQYLVEEALRAVGRGAAVLVDPSNGDILAMASVPSFDPNKFIPSISAADWQALNDDATDPLTNRATSAYAPGSTYKIPIALAGLKKGIGKSTFTCSGGVQYGNHFMKCWIAEKGGSHGTLGLSDAIKLSCNAFFYQYGNAAGIDSIVQTGHLLGLGEKSELGLAGESAGVLPGPEWLAMMNPLERWSQGHTANVAIGQGYVLATPLQMAMIAATVANGGTAWYPRLIDRVVSQQGGVIYRAPVRQRGNLRELGLSDAQIELVRRGMWKVVNEDGGTAKRARIKGVEVAGKTGTAQFWRDNKKDNHTWFICFAPYDKPRYALCVFVQGAKAGGLVSAPIAAKILESALALEKGEAPTLAALEPAPGRFDFIQEINFNREIPAALGTDGETTDVVPASLASSGGAERGAASPNIKPEVDEQGKVIPRARPARQRGEEAETKKPNFLQRLLPFGRKREETPRKPDRR